MKSFLIAFFLLLAASAAFAGESCSTIEKGDRGLVTKDVPCAALDVPIPCYEESRTDKGIAHTQRPCKAGEQKTGQQLQREEDAAQKKECGRDFGKLRVGMTLDRFEQCTEALSFVTETVMKGRVVETYRSTFYLVHASDGVIVAFTRRTN